MSWAEENAEQWAAIGKLKAARVRYVEATVTAADPGTSTFSVLVNGEQNGKPLTGIPVDPQLLPSENDTVILTVTGSQVIYQPAGLPSVNPDTVASFVGLNVTDDPIFQGVPLSQRLADVAGGKVVAFTADWPNPGATTTELGMIELACKTRPGYRYEIQAEGMIPDCNGADGVTVRFYARYTTDGSAPTISSPILAAGTAEARFDAFPWENEVAHLRGMFEETNATSRTLRVGLSYVNGAGASNTSIYTDPALARRIFTIKEVGPIQGTWGGQVNNMGGTSSLGVTTPPATARMGSETIFAASWGRVYNGSGGAFVDGSNGWQGLDSGGRGNTRTFVGFPDMTAIMAGATIDYIRLYTSWNYWYDPRGGYPTIGVHTNATAPATATGQPAVWFSFTNWRVPRVSSLWLDLPTSWFPSFANGTYKGVVLGPAPTPLPVGVAGDYFGKFDGPGTPSGPLLAIGWRK